MLHPGADARALDHRLTAQLAGNLRDLGVAEPIVSVKPCDALPRDPSKMGKLRLVIADGPGGQAAAGAATADRCASPPSAMRPA